eukprot:1075317-Prorocentrum_minimum.AAC.1
MGRTEAAQKNIASASSPPEALNPPPEALIPPPEALNPPPEAARKSTQEQGGPNTGRRNAPPPAPERAAAVRCAHLQGAIFAGRVEFSRGRVAKQGLNGRAKP